MAPEKSASTGTRGRRGIAAVLAGLLLLFGGFTAGRLSAPAVGTPSTTSAEAGFARDMQTHHNQAVEMSFMVRDLSDDPKLRLLAYDIAITQASQSGQLHGYLTEWGLPQLGAEPSMTWMTLPTSDGAAHEHGGGEGSAHTPGGPMPGLASPEQMAELATLRGVAAEKLYLQLMIAHHEGGVEMAEAVLERSDYPAVVTLARGLVTAQKSEIELMNGMLADLD